MDKEASLSFLGYVLIVSAIIPQVVRNFLTRDTTNFTILFPAILVGGLSMLIPSILKSKRKDLFLGTMANIVSALFLLLSVILFGGRMGL